MGERGGFDKDDVLVGPPDRACCSITRRVASFFAVMVERTGYVGEKKCTHCNLGVASLSQAGLGANTQPS